MKSLVFVFAAGIILASCTDKKAAEEIETLKAAMMKADSICKADNQMLMDSIAKMQMMMDSLMMPANATSSNTTKSSSTKTTTTTTSKTTDGKTVDSRGGVKVDEAPKKVDERGGVKTTEKKKDVNSRGGGK